MKKVLGLDIGTSSIGWAFINEAENDEEKSKIKKLGVRIIPITTDEESDFQKGKSITTNASRTLKRGMRRNLDRYQLRRDKLIEILKENKFIDDKTILSEEGKGTTFLKYKLRAKAVTEKISKKDFAKVLLMINKKRGYKSSRKTRDENDGTAIDGMKEAIFIHENNLTPGQYTYKLLLEGKKQIPDFYRSDLENELNKIWEFQKQFYSDILTDELKENIKGKNKGATWKILEEPFKLKGIKITGKRDEIKLEQYRLRTVAIKEKIDLEYLAIILQDINAQIKSSSGYLGKISDRSKELYIQNLTVGQYLYNQLKNNRHNKIKNQVFYRQDYIDEFNRIWEKQKEFYPELTEDLKEQIRDTIIFYQRKLKSQKGLLSHCEFESWEKEFIDKYSGKKKIKRVGHRVIPKSSPLFQEFKIWQILNNIKITDKISGEYGGLSLELKQIAFKKLNIVNKLSAKEFLKEISNNPRNFEINYQEIEGNRTNAALINAYKKIIEMEGFEYNYAQMSVSEILKIIKQKFNDLGIDSALLSFNSELEKDDFDKQSIMQLWHLLHASEEDKHITENISKKFGFNLEQAKIISKIHLQDDYGNLSSRAIRKVLPHLKEGNTFDTACVLAGYNHSHSEKKEEIKNRVLKTKLDLLPKNSLRNPIVEKILNQMVNIVNAIINDKNLGRPDEIRIELARELKKSAKERAEMLKIISNSTNENERIRKILQEEFKISKVTRNDIIRYKLWEELAPNGYHTLYTNEYIPKEKIFSKEFDIEHIIPQAKLFDDSFSNKTLAKRDINIEKANDTAYDYLRNKLSKGEFEQYLLRIEKLKNEGKISRTKFNKLKMKGEDIPDGFIDRDLRNSQYIARKAKEILQNIVKYVNTTTGTVTSKLRKDWQLIDIMKEINLPKYQKLGLVKTIEGKNGQSERQIIDWSKRNDHRHHAMDALTVAFTKPSHIQYLNHLSARGNEKHEKYHKVYGIEKKYLYRDNKNNLRFKPPMPINEFRAEAKKQLENILVSYKAKNKVVTRNNNKIKLKGKNNYKEKIELTPRGQLHNETIYGKIQQYITKEEKVGPKFDINKINQVVNKKYRYALLKRLEKFGNDPKKAFGGKNSPKNNPIYTDKSKTLILPEKIKLVRKDDQYTIRKAISPELKIEKVIDRGIKKILRKRLSEFGGDAKKAFSNLDENPIWQNKEKSIVIKNVTIRGINNAEPLHYKKDVNGKFILTNEGIKQPVDFVSTSNNHHVAIYRDENGTLHDEVISFYKAVWRSKEGIPIIDKNKNGMKFLFSMKQNEYFVFPGEDFNPNDIDLLDPENNYIISKYLYRVQKFSKVEYGNSAVRDYVFRHHLETQLIDKKETRNVTYKVFKSISELENIIKVRINHIGQIVEVGEY